MSERPFLGICPSFLFLNPKFSTQKFLNDLFRILPKFYIFSLENSDYPFLVIGPFLRFSALPYFHILQMMTPIPILCTLYTPCIHTHMLFSRFCTLLCALETVNIAYTIHFFLIHHCTNSLSSLHIFVHHCTFCASLHTKTSPGATRTMHTYSFIHSFIQAISIALLQVHYYSEALATQHGYCRSVTLKLHRQLRVKDLPKVPTWRLERDSNPRPFGRKATNLPMSHHAPRIFYKYEFLSSTCWILSGSSAECGGSAVGFGAFCPEGLRFESHSSCHVRTLGKSFTCCCLCL